MKCVDRIEDLLQRVGGRSRRQVLTHPKGEFGFGNAHFVARHGSGAAIGNDSLGQNASGHRAIDIDVLLPGFTGGCDLPAEQTCRGVTLDPGLDRVTFDTVVRP
jgi:hypothetical protein